MSTQNPVYRKIDVARLGGMPPFPVKHLMEIDPVVKGGVILIKRSLWVSKTTF